MAEASRTSSWLTCSSSNTHHIDSSTPKAGQLLKTDVARERAQEETNRISGIIDNLLDNITETNRDFVDTRLRQLTQQRQQLESRLEELDRLSLSQDEIKAIVDNSMKFLASLEFTLREGLPQEKLVALRQCIERVHIDKPAGKIKPTFHIIPCHAC